MSMKTVILSPSFLRDAPPFGAGDPLCVRENYAWGLWGARLLPTLALVDDAEAYAEIGAALLLTGGGDVRPSRYGEAPWREDAPYDDERDEMELRLFEAFCRRGKPVLGICRGIQLLNVALGGTLWQDVQSDPSSPERHGLIHEMEPAQGSTLRALFGERIRVNSFHHQAVRELGRGLRASAVNCDGVIEAVEHETLPILGVQWHPERAIGREESDLTDMRPLFKHFASLCR